MASYYLQAKRIKRLKFVCLFECSDVQHVEKIGRNDAKKSLLEQKSLS